MQLDQIIAAQPAGYALLQDLYNSEVAYQRDIERIFMRHWVLAGHASSAPEPGDYFLYEMGGESVIVIRGRDKELRALLNVCRHRGSRICTEQQGRASTLVCPYHAWSYNLDGSLRGARHMGEGFAKSAFGLKSIRLEVAEGLVFLSFAKEPLDFASVREAIQQAHGPYGWATAKVAHRQLYPIRSNWKLAVENYLECYHCAPSHKEYSELHALEQPLAMIESLNAAMEARTCALGLKVGSVDRWVGSETGQEAIFSFRYALYDGVRTGSRGGKPVAPLMGQFPDYDGGVTSTHFGPASFFVAYSDHGVLYRIMPSSASTCAMEVVWLVRGDAVEGRDYDKEELTWLWRVTTEADKKITEDNQAGVNSRFYEPGPYAPVEPNAKRWIAWYLEEIARA